MANAYSYWLFDVLRIKPVPCSFESLKPYIGRCFVYYLYLSGARVHDNGVANAILLRRYINIDYRCCDYGLYGTSTDASDVTSV